MKKSSHAEWGFNLLHNTNGEVGWRGRDEGGTHRVAPVRNMHLVSENNTVPGVPRFVMVRHEEKPWQPRNRVILRQQVHVAHRSDTVRPTFVTTSPADLVICIIPAGSSPLLHVNFSSR